jgi:DNA-binding HxlR family transcriptional regulator
MGLWNVASAASSAVAVDVSPARNASIRRWAVVSMVLPSRMMLRMSKQRHEDSASRSEAQKPRPGLPARGTRTGRPLLVAFDLLGRRWALRVLWELRDEHLGFRALQQRCGGMSSSVLRDRLVELSGAGLLEIDDQGRYGLSRHGQTLLEALKPLSSWSEDWGAEA